MGHTVYTGSTVRDQAGRKNADKRERKRERERERERDRRREGGEREVDCFQLGLEYKLANYSEIR